MLTLPTNHFHHRAFGIEHPLRSREHPGGPGLVAVLSLVAALIPGTTLAAGINLSWDDCGISGYENMNSACGADFGVLNLVGSVVPPSGLNRVVGFIASLDVQVEGNSLPSWWEMGEGCRRGRIGATFDFSSGPFACEDAWRGQAYGGMVFSERLPSNNRARITIVAAVAEVYERAMSPGTEYYLFKLNLMNAGTGACAGCATPACIQLTSVRLDQPAPLPYSIISERAHRSAAVWQGGISQPDSELPNCRADAVQNRTWGQVKSLYR